MDRINDHRDEELIELGAVTAETKGNFGLQEDVGSPTRMKIPGFAED